MPPLTPSFTSFHPSLTSLIHSISRLTLPRYRSARLGRPDIGAQANVNAWDAVSYWQQYMSPLKAQGHRLGMAATTSGSAGLQWINDFRTACPSCWDEVDFIPIHYYYNSVSNFQDYVTNFHAQTNKPLWVTEYACHNFAGGAQCSPDDTWNFHTSMDRWFSEQWFVERWAPFGVMKNMQGVEQANALMDPSGAITALGAWVSLT